MTFLDLFLPFFVFKQKNAKLFFFLLLFFGLYLTSMFFFHLVFTLGRATGDGGAKLRRAGLPTSRQPAGPFSGLGGTRLAALSAPAARLRLPADG
jgi:hypothetical protein